MSNKIKTQGIGKAMRKAILTDPQIGYVDKDLLLRAFLEELNERTSIKTKMSQLRCSEYLWYISYEGRLAMVKKGGMKSNAEKLLRDKWIVRDCYGIYRGTRVIDGHGCQHPKHRPIIDGLSRGKWRQEVVDKLYDMLDGGNELQMVIDRNFYDAYDNDYDRNEYIDDAVCAYSCMSNRPNEAEDFYGGIEGCYVARFLKDGENVGRCIMYTDGKIRHFIRIYCYTEYMQDCLYTLRRNMNPDDLFGRNEYIEGLELKTNFNEETPNMYLDGNRYGLKVVDGRLCVGTGYDWDCKETSDEYIGDCWEGIGQCKNCGEIFSIRRYDYIHDEDDGDYYCCEDCAREAGCYQCEHCDSWTSGGIVAEDGKHFCCSSCARAENYIKTDYYGRWVLEADAINIDGCYFFVDDEEIEQAGFHRCADCDKWTKCQYVCSDGKYRCTDCLVGGDWKLQYVKQEVKDDKEETSND